MIIAWLLIPAGVVIVWKTPYIVDHMIGEVAWAEKYIGAGGTYTFFRVLGIVVSILAFMWITGDLPQWLRVNAGKYFATPAN